MKPLTLFGLVITACSLAAIAYFQPGTAPSNTGNRILALDPASVSRVQLKNRDTTIVFSLQDGQWRMESPEVSTAIQERVHALILLTTAPSFTRYPLAGLDLKQFDLDNPLNQLQLDEHVISFGGIDPIRNKRYVSTESTLHLIDPAITGFLFKPYTYYIQTDNEAE